MGTRLVIVPNDLQAAIDREVGRFLALHPEAESERERMGQDLLEAFDRYGVVATLAPKQSPAAQPEPPEVDDE